MQTYIFVTDEGLKLRTIALETHDGQFTFSTKLNYRGVPFTTPPPFPHRRSTTVSLETYSLQSSI